MAITDPMTCSMTAMREASTARTAARSSLEGCLACAELAAAQKSIAGKTIPTRQRCLKDENKTFGV
jgi:hypothetical protein